MARLVKGGLGLSLLFGAASWILSPKELAKAIYYDRLIKMIEPYMHYDFLKASLLYLPAFMLVLIGIVLFAETIRQAFPKKLTIIKKDLDICLSAGPNAPYVSHDVQHGQTLSTVKIGVKNTGKQHLSNCKLYIERIAPLPPLVGGLPILLNDGNFTLRNDDPERIIDIASHWGHVDKFRFNSPHGGFAESLNYISDEEPRTIVIRFAASGLVRSSSYKLWTDNERILHLHCLGSAS